MEDYSDTPIGEMSLVFSERCLEKMEKKNDIMNSLNIIYQKKPETKTGKLAGFRKLYQYIRMGDLDNAISYGKNILQSEEDTIKIKMALYDMGNLLYVDKKDIIAGAIYYHELIKRFPYDILSSMAKIRLGEGLPEVKDNKNENKVKIETEKSGITLNNYPNPFNPTTVISFRIPGRDVTCYVSLKVFDILGREIKTLINGKMESGRHEVEFNANGMASGIYFYRLTVQPSDGTKAVVINKSMQVVK
jgi:hypothetical protein